MESWRKNRLAFAVLTLPPSLWLVIFFTLPLIIIWIYSFADRGPQGQVLLGFTLVAMLLAATRFTKRLD